MYVTFYGAAREVTGSMHMISTGSDRILLDCGMFQGRRKESTEKNKVLPFDPRIIGNIVLSHAHIDHSGRIPMLAKRNFHGRVICTRVTADADKYLLLDSAHIQESDAAYLNYKTARNYLKKMKSADNRKQGGQTRLTGEEIKEIKKRLRHENNRLNTESIHRLLEANELNTIEPLYTTEDAEKAITILDGYPYQTPVTISQDMTCTFYDAGHILGSAICVIKSGTEENRKTIMYSGDIGRFGKPILRNPTLHFAEEDRKIDLLIMESTYGDRTHDPVADLKGQLQEVVAETLERNGTVVIPSFAYGRTQDLIYTLHELYNEKAIPKVPIFIDSPLAIKLTRVFGEHPEVYDQATHQTFLEKGQNPFSFEQVNFVTAVEESMALMRRETPHIAIAASGMCEAGRILHHLRYRCHNPLNTILIVGYMAKYTLGRRMLEEGLEYEKSGREGPPPTLKILGKKYPLKARVARIDGFSAHGDRDEMLRFLKEANLEIKRIAVVHGEEDQSLAFAKRLEQEGYPSVVPKMGETVEVK